MCSRRCYEDLRCEQHMPMLPRVNSYHKPNFPMEVLQWILHGVLRILQKRTYQRWMQECWRILQRRAVWCKNSQWYFHHRANPSAETSQNQFMFLKSCNQLALSYSVTDVYIVFLLSVSSVLFKEANAKWFHFNILSWATQGFMSYSRVQSSYSTGSWDIQDDQRRTIVQYLIRDFTTTTTI